MAREVGILLIAQPIMLAGLKKEKIMENRKTYCRIDFINCGSDYDFTICEWDDVSNQIQIAESDFFIGSDEFNEIEKDDTMPEIKIILVLLTYDEFTKAIKSYDK